VHERRIKILQESKRQETPDVIENESRKTDSQRLRLEDRRISVALMSSFVVLAAQYLVLVATGLMGTALGHNVQFVSKVLVGAAFTYALPIVLRRSATRLIVTYVIGIAVFLIHYVVFPENNTYQRQLIFGMFFLCLPSFIYSSAIDDWETLRDVMNEASFIVLSLGTLLAIMVLSGHASVGAYSMPLSYYLVLPAVVFIDAFLDRLSSRYLVFSLLSVFLIMAIGARGPMMCILTFVTLRLVRPHKKLGHAHVFAYLVVLSLTMIVGLSLDNVLTSINLFLSRFDISSRSIVLFLRPGLYLSGRDVLYNTVAAEIANNPFKGIGIGGDRRVLGGSYVHNIVIEIMANYGIVFGTLFISMLLVLMIRYFMAPKKHQYGMFVIWLSVGMIPLAVSGSYLESMSYWIFLGLISKDIDSSSRR